MSKAKNEVLLKLIDTINNVAEEDLGKVDMLLTGVMVGQQIKAKETDEKKSA